MKNIVSTLIFKITNRFKRVFNLIVKSKWEKFVDIYYFLFRNKSKKKLLLMLKLNYPLGAAKLLYDFYRVYGDITLRYFIEHCNLKPKDRVLDIGCGPGRIAYALTKYLTTGSYEGMDIIPQVIKWCSKTFTQQYPNFLFLVTDIYNKWYNPKGKYKASNYKFPYKNESFDFVFLTSVFTHMLPKDMENYFSEISRVLKCNGRCLISFFLINPESLKLIHAKKCTRDFKYDYKKYRTTKKN